MLQITGLVSCKKAGKLSDMNLDGLSAIGSLQWQPQGSGQTTFLTSRLNQFFVIYRESSF
jgi:hypothetical protein